MVGLLVVGMLQKWYQSKRCLWSDVARPVGGWGCYTIVEGEIPQKLQKGINFDLELSFEKGTSTFCY
jgi:hypothetical protein